jgi:RNA polymerase sigma factor (sigma-70 family)
LVVGTGQNTCAENNENTVDESSAELLERYRQGDSHAADALFARYVERLTEMVRWLITPAMQKRLDPEDPVNSAYRSFFVRARHGHFVLEHSGDLWKLLVTITLNKLRRQIAHHRAQKRAVNKDRPLTEASSRGIEVGAGPSPLEALAAADELETLMVKLSPLQRQVLELRLQEHHWDEIALATGRSERTVRRALEEVRLVWQKEVEAGLARHPARPSELVRCRAALLPSPNSREGQSKGLDPRSSLDYRDFVLNELVGSGGMGKVYRAQWRSRARTVAVKMLRKSYWTVTGAVERWSGSSLKHES